MKKIFQQGDIMVFKAGNHWLSQSIALLTHSDVSHAAMVYQEDTVIEMELSGIRVSKLETEPGDNTYLMRLTPQMDTQPLIDAACMYLNAKNRYDMPGLVILAGLLIYHEFRPTPEFVAITDLILKAAAKALDKLIQKVILDNPDKAMVCSQLVYQIYADCKEDYHIHLENAVLSHSPAQNTAKPCHSMIRLIDIIHNSSPRNEDILPGAASTELTEDDTEELAHRLYLALQKQCIDADNPVSIDRAVDTGSLVCLSKKFLELIEEFLEKAKSDIPIDGLFVTPADLVYHAKNLCLIGSLHTTRHV